MDFFFGNFFALSAGLGNWYIVFVREISLVDGLNNYKYGLTCYRWDNALIDLVGFQIDACQMSLSSSSAPSSHYQLELHLSCPNLS